MGVVIIIGLRLYLPFTPCPSIEHLLIAPGTA